MTHDAIIVLRHLGVLRTSLAHPKSNMPAIGGGVHTGGGRAAFNALEWCIDIEKVMRSLPIATQSMLWHAFVLSESYATTGRRVGHCRRTIQRSMNGALDAAAEALADAGLIERMNPNATKVATEPKKERKQSCREKEIDKRHRRSQRATSLRSCSQRLAELRAAS